MVYNTTMVKMSDIFKKIEERKKEVKASQPLPATPAPAIPIVAPPEVVYQHAPAAAEIRIIPPSLPPQEKNEAEVAVFTECEKAYNDALALMQEIMKEDALYEFIDAHQISSIIEKLVELSRAQPGKMTELFLSPDIGSQATYLCGHMVNVCGLAILLGLELGYTQDRLKELGIAALLHDVGMTHYLGIISQSKKLNKEDFDKVKNHTLFSAKILSSIKGLDDIVFVVARQHHERMDGSGYPDGLKGEQIHEYSSIVSILDIYEALMHRRTYRNETQARETIQEILKNKNAYDPKLIKILINRIGIFPIGSLVELNTQELARVVSLNHNNILRPVVKIITNANGEECTEEKLVNLAAEPAIWIKHIDKE